MRDIEKDRWKRFEHARVETTVCVCTTSGTNLGEAAEVESVESKDEGRYTLVSNRGRGQVADE